MKTTKGKTKTPRPKVRVAIICRLEDDKVLGTRACTTLKQAVLDYFEETLKPKGYKNPKANGNVLTVTTKQGKTVMYRALDTYPSR